MIENILQGFLIFFIITWIIALILYLPRFLCYFYAFKKQKRLTNETKNKIAVIVPARNESSVIGDLLASVKNQTYNKDYYDVFILVKDDNDPTIEIASESGCIVYVVKEQTCKGDALDYCLKKILSECPDEYQAYLIVDADCVMDRMMLEELNNALASGKQVIQTKKIVKNYLPKYKNTRSLSACCNGLIWTIIDELGNKGKTFKNATNMTIGTGIMIRSDIIKELGGWIYRETLTEDIEFMYDCVCKDYSTFYYCYAKLYVEEAVSLSMTNKRRTRWLTGVIDSRRIYSDRLERKVRESHNYTNKYYSTALEPVYLYIGSLSFFCIINVLLSVIFILFKSEYFYTTFVYFFMGFGIIYVSFFILTLFCIIKDYKHMRISIFRKLLVLFIHPLFYMGYIPIIYKAFRNKNKNGWEVIERISVENE